MKFTNGDIGRTHYVNNMLVLNLVHALIKISNEQNLKDEKGILPDNQIHFEDGYEEMLDEIMSKMENQIKDFMFLDKHRKISRKLKNKVDTKMYEIIVEISKIDVNLEVLSMYIMYINFVKADVIHENFKEFTDVTYYKIVVDAYESSGFSKKISMYSLAKRIIQKIK
jgi:hypothetical protein